jgi:hypothetical protein
MATKGKSAAKPLRYKVVLNGFTLKESQNLAEIERFIQGLDFPAQGQVSIVPINPDGGLLLLE